MVQAKPIPYNDPGVPDLMTPAERWTFVGDSYHETERGQQLLKDKRDWFRPVGVLEGSLSIEEALKRRQELPPIKSTTMLDMFGKIMLPTEIPQGSEVVFRLAVPIKDDGTIDEKTTEILEPPTVLVVRDTEEAILEVEKEGRKISLTEAYFNFMQEFGNAYNPYRKERQKKERETFPPEGGVSRR